MKFLVLSFFVVACSALPATYSNYGSSSYSSAPRTSFGSQYRSQSYGASHLSAPRVNLVGHSGLSNNYLTTGFLGNTGLNYQHGAQYALVQAAAPAVSYVQATPSVQYVQAAAPAVSYVQAAPALQTVAIQAAPAVSYAHQSASAHRAESYALPTHKSDSFQGVVPAAIQQIARTVEYRPIPNQEQPIQAQVVEVEPSDNPVHLHFKTRSSTLSVSQAHTPAEAQEVQSSSAQDEPQRLITEVQKPVIQEVREVISPYRQVTQEINPVQESLHTVVSKGELRQQYTAQKQNYAQNYQTVQAAPAVQSYAVQAAPAVQSYAVQAAPVQTIAVQAAPAVAQIAVEAAPVAVQTIAAPAYSTGYSAQYSAAPAYSTGYSAQYSAAPSTSYVAVQQPHHHQKQVSSIHSSGY